MAVSVIIPILFSWQRTKSQEICRTVGPNSYSDQQQQASCKHVYCKTAQIWCYYSYLVVTGYMKNSSQCIIIHRIISNRGTTHKDESKAKEFKRFRAFLNILTSPTSRLLCIIIFMCVTFDNGYVISGVSAKIVVPPIRKWRNSLHVIRIYTRRCRSENNAQAARCDLVDGPNSQRSVIFS